uniref:Uncharacterized protein n=1 Tax=Ditylenchus dipsaci TaxID=166011 RepID=A0A915DWC1_9BILA
MNSQYYRGRSPNRARTPVNAADGTGVDDVFVPLPPKNSKQGIEYQKRKIRAYSKELAVPAGQHNSVRKPTVAPRSPAYSANYPDQQHTFKSHQITPSAKTSSSFSQARNTFKSRDYSNEPDEQIPSRDPDRKSSFGATKPAVTAKLRGMTPVEPPAPKKPKGRPPGSVNKARSVSKQPKEPPKTRSRAPSTASNTAYNARSSSRQLAEPPKRRGRTPQVDEPPTSLTAWTNTLWMNMKLVLFMSKHSGSY